MAKRRKPSASFRKSLSHAVALTAVFAAALCLRLVYIDSIHTSPSARVLQTNALRYHLWAQAILDGNAPPPPFDQPPAYAYFLAAAYWFAGNASPEVVRPIQAVLDAVHCVLLANLVARSGLPLASVWFTGLLAAVYGPFIFFTGEILPASISLLLLATAVNACSEQRWLAASVLWLLATLFRAELLLPLSLYVAWLFFRGNGSTARQLGTVVVVGWLVATVAVSIAARRIVPYTSGLGLNLWLGNNPYADGVNPFPPAPLQAAVERARTALANDVVKLDRWFLSQAIGFWREYPWEALRLTWKKFRWTLVDRELPNTGDVTWQQGHSWLFRLPFFPLSFGALLCLGSGGLAVSLRRYPWSRTFGLLGIVALSTLLTCTMFFTNGRFRLPLAPFLLFAAAHLPALLTGERWARNLRPHLPTVLASIAFASWIAFANPFNVKNYYVPALVTNAGIAERLAGRPDKAIALLERALASAREDDLAWSHLALAREQAGDLAGAANAYLDALTFAPHSSDLRALAKDFCARHGIDDHWIDHWTASPSPTERLATRVRILQSFHAPRGATDSSRSVD